MSHYLCQMTLSFSELPFFPYHWIFSNTKYKAFANVLIQLWHAFLRPVERGTVQCNALSVSTAYHRKKHKGIHLAHIILLFFSSSNCMKSIFTRYSHLIFLLIKFIAWNSFLGAYSGCPEMKKIETFSQYSHLQWGRH